MSIGERFVAVCDVLGFSDLSRQVDLAELSNRYRGLTHIARPKNWQISFHGQFGGDSGDDDDYEETLHTHVGHIVFSDTILIWAAEDEWSVQAFFEHLTEMTAESIRVGLPLRVGIAFGQCDIDRKDNIYLGPAIVDAYITEKAQLWAGGACHPSCDSNSWFWYYIIRETQMAVEYNVPTHQGKEVPPWALNWVTPFRITKGSPELSQCIESSMAKAPSQEAQLKWINTRTFFNSQMALLDTNPQHEAV